MTGRPLLSMTLIARNEAGNIDRCFSSWWDHVDEVVLLDTGSTDGTITAARAYAKSKGEPKKLKVGRFKWRDDFAAARQAADELATGQWVVWCDLDDTIQGLDVLREHVAGISSEVVAFFCRYSYAQDPDANTISELWRERIVRNVGIQWTGRLHEHKVFTQGGIVRVDPEDCEWLHHRDHSTRTGERNVRILEKWDKAEPNNPRVIHSLAMEFMGEQKHQEAADTFERYLDLDADTPDRRAQATRHLCVELMLLDRRDEARARALKSLEELWLWADTHLTLAEIAQMAGNPTEGIVHANAAMQIGKPDTLLIINPLQYTAHPKAIISLCLAQLGRWDEAVRMAEEVVAISPSYQLIEQHLPGMRGELRKEHAVAAFVACAQVLVETGELLKAQEMLRCAPWYVQSRPELIEWRTNVRQALEQRRGQPARQEDAAADLFVQRLRDAA